MPLASANIFLCSSSAFCNIFTCKSNSCPSGVPRISGNADLDISIPLAVIISQILSKSSGEYSSGLLCEFETVAVSSIAVICSKLFTCCNNCLPSSVLDRATICSSVKSYPSCAFNIFRSFSISLFVVVLCCWFASLINDKDPKTCCPYSVVNNSVKSASLKPVMPRSSNILRKSFKLSALASCMSACCSSIIPICLKISPPLSLEISFTTSSSLKSFMPRSLKILRILDMLSAFAFCNVDSCSCARSN